MVRFRLSQEYDVIQKNKIIVPDYNNTSSFSYDTGGHYFKTGYGVLLNDEQSNPYFILGLLNSRLLFSYLKSIGTSLRGGYVRFWSQYIEQLPIRTIDFSDPADKSRHDRIVSLVESMLSLHKQLWTANTGHEKTALQRQIDATDRQIDQLVYELYGLTDEDIRIVEGDVSKN